MQSNYKKLFLALRHQELPKKLYGDILTRIAQEQRRIERLHAAFLGAVTICSFIVLIPAFQFTLQELSQSGFTRYLSLLFSDSAVVTTYWKEFALSLAESLPLFGITLLLVAIFTLFYSLILTIKHVQKLFTSTHVFS
jgi:hypothetical protein